MTSVRAAVVLSVGLLRLVSRAWVVEVVLSVVLVLLLDVKAGIPLALGDIKVVLVVTVVEEDVGCFAVASGVGIIRGAEEKKHFKYLIISDFIFKHVRLQQTFSSKFQPIIFIP